MQATENATLQPTCRPGPQPPEEWLPRQIQQTPGLDKCIFPV